MPRVLSIAGTDPTGGAGIQADLKSIMAAGGYGMSVVTALVAQNTQGVRDIHIPPVDFLRQQLAAVAEDVVIDAVKIGMLGSADVARVVTDFIDRDPAKIVVVDPVMVSTSGDSLFDAAAKDLLIDLIQRATVVTPNIPELATLSGIELQDITSREQAIDIAAALAEQWNTSFVVKAGHLTGTTDRGNTLVAPGQEPFHVKSPAVDTRNTHGTGCSLSSALATRMVVDEPREALAWATTWLHAAIATADSLHIGRGHGPVNHSVWLGEAHSRPAR